MYDLFKPIITQSQRQSQLLSSAGMFRTIFENSVDPHPLPYTDINQ